MSELRLSALTRLVFVGISVAMIAACTTAPRSFLDILPAPKIETPPPLQNPAPLLTTTNETEISHDDGVVVAIPKDLLSTPVSSMKKQSDAPAATTSTANNSDLGEGFRALEAAEGCCGTGCAKACTVQ